MKHRIALLATAVALPFSMLACSDDEPANAVPDDVQAVVDEYQASWNDYDSEAFLELVTDDYVFINGNTETEREAQADIIGDGTLSGSGWSAEAIGDPIAAGDGPYQVAMTNHLEWRNSPDGEDGISTVTVVDDDGELKVSEHVWVTG